MLISGCSHQQEHSAHQPVPSPVVSVKKSPAYSSALLELPFKHSTLGHFDALIGLGAQVPSSGVQ